MKEKIILVGIGLLFGLALTAGTYPLLKKYAASRVNLPEGAQFETLEDFQRAMLARDTRDVKADRSVSLRSIITPHPNDRIMYDLLPNLDVRFQRVNVKTNSCGMRSPERPISKPANTYRIALLGDSFTFGWGVEYPDSFAHQMEQILNDRFAGSLNVEVLNFGIPGYSTFQEIELYSEKAMQFQPDAVLIFFVDNDFGLPFFIKSVHKKGSVVTGTSFARASWKKNDPLVDEQNKKLMSLLDPNRALRRLIKVTKPEHVPIFFTINPRPDWKEQKRKIWALREYAQDITFLNLRPGFMRIVESNAIDKKDLSLKNDPHPSPIKHRILGEVLAAELFPYLAESSVATNS